MGDDDAVGVGIGIEGAVDSEAGAGKCGPGRGVQREEPETTASPKTAVRKTAIKPLGSTACYRPLGSPAMTVSRACST